MQSRFSALLCASLLFVAARADAHSLLINPPPLTNDDNAKAGPCGCYFGAGPEDPNEDTTATACPSTYKVTDIEAGSQLQVTWKETVNHTGKFRVSFSDKPIDTVTRANMDAGVLYEADDANTVSGGVVSAMITVPDVPCTNCVIQLRQFMSGATKPYYYTCAAVNVLAAGSSASSSSSSASSGAGGGGGGSGGSGGDPGSDTGSGESICPGPAPIQQTTASGYCSVSPGSEGSPAVIGMGILGILAMRWRRKRAG